MQATTWTAPTPNRRSWPRGPQPSGRSAIAETVLAWLIAHGGETTAGNDTIGNDCVMAPRTVRKALNELEHDGLVSREVLGGGRRVLRLTDRPRQRVA